MKQTQSADHAMPDTQPASSHAGADAHPLQRKIETSPRQRDQQSRLAQLQAAPARPDLQGLPLQLRAGIESLAGMDMGDVVVHRNSDKPAQLNALAYAQGNHIHLGPGQEAHLPHEAWHVVQQAKGRVPATARTGDGIPVNDDRALEREADVMGARALQRHPMSEQQLDLRSGAAPVHLQAKFKPAGAGMDAPIQGRFTQGGKRYSFLSAHDLDGSPYLASKNGRGQTENWKIKNEQNAVELEPITDLYSEVGDEDLIDVYHNLSMGREQRISTEGQKAILNPFKTYTFGANKVPDVAVFNVGVAGAEPGKLYPHYKTQLSNIHDTYMLNKNTKAASKAIAAVKAQMMPLIIAEDYRTRGATDVFKEAWDELEAALKKCSEEIKAAAKKRGTKEPANKRPKRGEGPTALELADARLTTAIKGATTDLPWAGDKGKNAFRQSYEDHNWVESTRPINRGGVSPIREDTGGKWEKDEEEEEP